MSYRQILISPSKLHLLTNQKQEIEQWLLTSPIYNLSYPFTTSEIGSVVSDVIKNNDGLTLAISRDGKYYTKKSTSDIIDNSYTIVSLSNDNYDEKHKNLIQLRNNIDDIHSPIVLVAFSTDNKTVSSFCFTVHHSVADRESMVLITNEIFSRLALISQTNNCITDFKRGSFLDYLDRHAHNAYSPKCSLKSVPAGLNNDSKTLSLNYEMASTDYRLDLAIELGLSIEEALISILAMAFKKTYNESLFEVEIVRNGRTNLSNNIVGWISQTSLLSLQAQDGLESTAKINSEEIDKVMSHKNSQLTKRSNTVLNIIDSSKNPFNYQGLLSDTPTPSGIPYFGDNSQRIYVMAIGVILQSKSFSVIIDYAKSNESSLSARLLLENIRSLIEKNLSPVLPPQTNTQGIKEV
ncbi:hypothetical protein HB763_14030 [Vibrio campbellii]|uniref:hypothetical protein n=1 Tax=Vibrio campbellii TaxID=680 RepID=UPI0021086264|nr:hypothetical protein [Vibrio campbellii]UTZ37704.1 hypothetical protein HB763_14030 [Vibrio campbellii]